MYIYEVVTHITRESKLTLQPTVGPWPLFYGFLILYTVGRIPWTEDQPDDKHLPSRRTAQTQNKHTHKHRCLEWDSNRQYKCLEGVKKSVP
jgi:hypothetical protein